MTYDMDKQSKFILEKIHNIRSLNPRNQSKNLIGDMWTEESSFFIFKSMSAQDIGKWGELMFEESFGLSSKPTGIDLPTLNADIKTFTRAYKRTKFSGGASVHLNPDWYFTYLIFPNEYRLYRIPSDDKVIKTPDANGEKGKIDITAEDLERFEMCGYRYEDRQVDRSYGTRRTLEGLFG
ncbi:hypothetical protein CMI47_07720 [Candidatus Pacearchaeota archaeon]|nr:hypothetical protein [Candidatus Pacearchaeota archaeon]|tara:strand:- start:146 stop:685 length:540 start_codon:yes stop_codon:yes gene_type:complete